MFTKSSFLTTHLSPLLKLGPYFLQAVQSFELILMNSDLGFISIGKPLTKLYKKCLISRSHLEKAHPSILFWHCHSIPINRWKQFRFPTWQLGLDFHNNKVESITISSSVLPKSCVFHLLKFWGLWKSQNISILTIYGILKSYLKIKNFNLQFLVFWLEL